MDHNDYRGGSDNYINKGKRKQNVETDKSSKMNLAQPRDRPRKRVEIPQEGPPQEMQKKERINFPKTDFNYASHLIGPGGSTVQGIEAATNSKIRVFGNKYATIEAKSDKKIEEARDLISPILDGKKQKHFRQWEYYKRVYPNTEKKKNGRPKEVKTEMEEDSMSPVLHSKKQKHWEYYHPNSEKNNGGPKEAKTDNKIEEALDLMDPVLHRKKEQHYRQRKH